MPIIKCKMCGGDIELAADKTFGTCEYCGSTMTLPKVSDEQRAAAFNRGNHFRRIGEFDKALAVYERIVAEDDNDAEAHWCCALCRFGIEYVEDPATYEWLPTCHRASFDSFLEDVDYLAALENSDGITRRQYQKDAAKIAEVQRGILATSQNTEPYDVFISYKELDENGNRTRDSILAQEIYYRLTEKGWRVFFSRISLEDVPGTEYEPYIFAALNSAKVMIVVGTSAENLNAVWVKNEWSRFLSMMRKDRTKLLIPCYRDMDPYDLPEQLSVLMSYDMGKIGFVQDLIRGVNKVLSAEKKGAEPVKETVVVQQSSGGPNVSALLKRGQQALEDGEWDKASDFFDQVLNMDAENAEAFLGLALAENHCSDAESYFQKIGTLSPKKEYHQVAHDNWKHISEMNSKFTVPNYLEPKELAAIYDFKTTYESETRSTKEQVEQIKAAFQADRNLSRAFRYAQGATKQRLEGSKNELFELLDSRLSSAETAEALSKEQAETRYVAKLKEADEYAEKKNRAALKKLDEDYLEALAQVTRAACVSDYEAAKRKFLRFGTYKDSVVMAERCGLEIEKIEKAAREEAERRRQEEAEEAERQRVLKEKAERERKAKNKKIGIITGTLAVLAVAAVLLLTKVIIPNNQYKAAQALLEEGQYEKAISAFEAMNGYKDSTRKIKECEEAILARDYAVAEELLIAEKYEDAIEVFRLLDGYGDSAKRIEEAENAIMEGRYAVAEELFNAGQFFEAIKAFKELGDYKDSADMVAKCRYNNALFLAENGEYPRAIAELEALDNYEDSEEKLTECYYSRAIELTKTGNFKEAIAIFKELGDYRDSEECLTEIYIERFKTVAIGETVSFGNYEQDNNNSNGKEEIEWQVLAKEGNRLLVISKYGIDCKQFNTSYGDVTWETCSLRQWLNGEFMNTAFSSAERAMIPSVRVSADKEATSIFSLSSGNSTQDQIFLLSQLEADKYFSTDNARKCEPTKYAIVMGCETLGGNSLWWLRTRGSGSGYFVTVDWYGEVGSSGATCISEKCAVRPVLWIDLKS